MTRFRFSGLAFTAAVFATAALSGVMAADGDWTPLAVFALLYVSLLCLTTDRRDDP